METKDNGYTGADGKFKKGNKGKPKGAISQKRKIWDEVGDWFVNEGLEAYTENLEEMLTSGNPIKKNTLNLN
jgi:hypothetical protein